MRRQPHHSLPNRLGQPGPIRRQPPHESPLPPPRTPPPPHPPPPIPPPLKRHAFGQPARPLILQDASLTRRHGRQSALTTAGGALPSPSRGANICAASRTTPCRIASGSPAQSVASPAMKVTSTRPAAPEAVTRTHPSPLP